MVILQALPEIAQETYVATKLIKKYGGATLCHLV